MNDRDARFESTEADELENYRTLSATAMVALLVGLLSPLALVRLLLIVVPICGGFLAIWALIRIRRSEGRLVGKWLAVFGLGFATFFGIAAASEAIARQQLLLERSRPLAEAWLTLLTRGEPHKALELTRPELGRRPLDDDLWNFYRRDVDAWQALEKFSGEEMISVLLTLGKRAEIRHVADGNIVPAPPSGKMIGQYFAVTYDDDSGEKKTFFVALQLERKPGARTGKGQWRVADFIGGIEPVF